MKNKIINTILAITTLCLLIIVAPISHENSNQLNDLGNVNVRSNQVISE